MKLVLLLALCALAALAGPLALDAWDVNASQHLLTPRPQRDAAPAPTAKDAGPQARLADALALGRPLSGTLFLVSDLATRSGLAFSTVAVQPPQFVSASLSEHRARVAVTGTARSVNRFIQTLPELRAPLRIEAARLTGPTTRESFARLELDLRVLVSAE